MGMSVEVRLAMVASRERRYPEGRAAPVFGIGGEGRQGISMRVMLSAGLAMIAAAVSVAPAQAQGGTFMWCAAWSDNGVEKSYYYSGFFAAGAWEADRKAAAFKAEVADEEISAATVTATCMAPVAYDQAVAARNAAMKGAPGEILSWEG
jgi:hypothetical protein